MSAKQRFLVNLIFDPEYDGYVADVPQLPGCMSQGKSVEAALKNVRKGVAVYLKASRHARPVEGARQPAPQRLRPPRRAGRCL